MIILIIIFILVIIVLITIMFSPKKIEKIIQNKTLDWIFFRNLNNFLKEHSKSEEEKINNLYKISNDSFIYAISWNPLKNNSLNGFRKINLIKKQNWILEYRMSRYIFFELIFWISYLLVIFILFIKAILPYIYENIINLELNYIISITLFFIVLLWIVSFIFDIFKAYYKLILFDINNWFIKIHECCFNKEFNQILLTDLYGIQILSKYISGSWTKKWFYSYELNLVFKNKKRINIIDHWNFIKIRNDAKIISEYIWIPVWDITSTYL